MKDTSLLKFLENSLSDGLLYHLTRDALDEAALERTLSTLFAFWSAVKAVWPAEWGRRPKESRLFHGAGVTALGFLMDTVAHRHRAAVVPTRAHFIADLKALAPLCHWSSGTWDFGSGVTRGWNEVQNTTRDVELLARHLLRGYRARAWRRAPEPLGGQLLLEPPHHARDGGAPTCT